MPVGSITCKRKTSPRTRQGEQEVTFCSENRTDVKKNRTPSRLRGADPFHYSQTMRDSSPEDHATPHGGGLYILSTCQAHRITAKVITQKYMGQGLGWVAPIGMQKVLDGWRPLGWKVLDGSICRTNASELFGLAKLCLKGLQNYKPRPSPGIASQELNFYTLHPPTPTPSMLVATSSAITMAPMMSVTVSCCTGLSIALSTNMPLRNVSQDVHPQNKHLRFSFRRTQQIPPFPSLFAALSTLSDQPYQYRNP